MLKNALVIILAMIVIGLCFYLAPIDVGFDYKIMQAAVTRFVSGEIVYQIYDNTGFFYAPWFTLVLSPLAFLPLRLGFVVLNCLNLLCVLAACYHYRLSLVHTILILASPPMIYNLMGGQVDPLLLTVLFIPKSFWLLIAVAKPQATLGFGVALLRKPHLWLKALIIFVIGFGISLFIAPNWPIQIIEMSRLQFSGTMVNNLLEIWPFNLIFAAGFFALAIDKDEDRLYLLGSPFVLKYASTGNYMLFIFALVSYLKAWQAALIVVVWWITLFMRG